MPRFISDQPSLVRQEELWIVCESAAQRTAFDLFAVISLLNHPDARAPARAARTHLPRRL